MTITLDLCAGLTLEADYIQCTPDDGRYHRDCLVEVRVYVEGVQIEIEGVLEGILGEQLSGVGVSLHWALAEEWKKATEEES